MTQHLLTKLTQWQLMRKSTAAFSNYIYTILPQCQINSHIVMDMLWHGVVSVSFYIICTFLANYLPHDIFIYYNRGLLKFMIPIL